jgi:hypothetical protein
MFQKNDVFWVQLAQDKVQLWAVVNTVMISRVSQKQEMTAHSFISGSKVFARTLAANMGGFLNYLDTW